MCLVKLWLRTLVTADGCILLLAGGEGADTAESCSDVLLRRLPYLGQ